MSVVGTFAVPSDELLRLAYQIPKGALGQTVLVAVSGVLARNADDPRFQAVLDTVRASCQAGVMHLIMLDNSSHIDALQMLRSAGAIVVVIDHDTQGGLARPYVIAAQLINLLAPGAIMVKVEGEKPLFAHSSNVAKICQAARSHDVITGERSPAAWASMPPYQVVTEVFLGRVIGEVLGVSCDTPSGILILNQAGRDLFVASTDLNSWPYLFIVPFVAKKRRFVKVGTVEVDFQYHPAVVKEETSNPKFDEKRRNQIDAMLDTAVATAGGERALTPVQLAAVTSLRIFRQALKREAAA